MTTVSVIIPTLNEAAVLPSTLAQTVSLGFDELLVVDGGSEDGTAEAVRPYLSMHAPQPVTFVTGPRGRARQMNLGTTLARGDVFLFLHADTHLPANARALVHEALRDPACPGGRFDVSFDRPTALGGVVSRLINLRSRLSGIATGDQAIFVRRSVFERLGGFADIPLMEDVDLSRRLKRVGRPAALRAQVVTSFRRWETCGPIRTILFMWLLRFLYWTGVSPVRLSHLYVAIR